MIPLHHVAPGDWGGQDSIDPDFTEVIDLLEQAHPNLHEPVRISEEYFLSPILKFQLDLTGTRMLVYDRARRMNLEFSDPEHVRAMAKMLGLEPLGRAFGRFLQVDPGNHLMLVKQYAPEAWE